MRIGRYELGRLLGEGGAGRVYEADLHGPGGFRKAVALKVLHHQAAGLRREARIGGLLRHRHIVDVYEVGEDQGRWFCALELCRNGSLADHLPLPPRAVVEVGLAVCDALSYAHGELGLVHLDLKPPNLLLDGGVVKVADLGIAHARGFEEGAPVRGTPGYMAPEQLQGEPADVRADIHALGVTLAELATGSRTGAERTFDELQEPSVTLVMEEIDAESAAGGSVWLPPWLRPAIVRCVDPSPEARYASMDELAAALRALQVDGPGLREALGLDDTAGAAAEVANPLADPGDAFVGRDDILARLAGLFARPGLFVVKGPAGIGKTRLVRVAAGAWRAQQGRPAWFADLGTVRDAAGLVRAVATVLEAPLDAVGPDRAIELVGRAMAARGPILLVLDTFEQLVEATAVVARWRALAPEARIVVTSRAALRLPGEELVELGPLAPADAAALLAARARARGADIAGEGALDELVEKLDGVPLALELAAGRLGVLGVQEVADQLGLSLLRSGRADRHATLHAALDGSWELLSEVERQSLCELAVFRGPSTLEAAEAVLDTRGPAAIDRVQALVDASLLQVRPDGRFQLLSSVQAYAAERHDPADRRAAELRHGATFAALGREDFLQTLRRHGGAARRRALALELPNLRCACERATARGDVAVAAATAIAAWSVLEMTGPFADAVDLLEAVLAMPGGDAVLRARAQLAAARAHGRVGTFDRARPHIDAVLATACAGSRLEGMALSTLCGLDATEGRHAADGLSAARRAVAIHSANGDRGLAAAALGQQGEIERALGRGAEARASLREARAILRALGDRMAEGIVLGSLGLLDSDQGHIDRARAAFREAIGIQRALGNRRSLMYSLSNLAIVDAEQGQLGAARAGLDQALTITRELGNRPAEGVVLGHLALIDATEGLHEAAEARLRTALAIHQELGERVRSGLVLANLGRTLASRGRIEEAWTTLDQALAIHREVGDRRSEAMSLASLGDLSGKHGRPEHARRHLEAAVALQRELDAPPLLARMLDALASVHARAGRAAEARAARHEAETLRRSLGRPDT